MYSHLSAVPGGMVQCWAGQVRGQLWQQRGGTAGESRKLFAFCSHLILPACGCRSKGLPGLPLATMAGKTHPAKQSWPTQPPTHPSVFPVLPGVGVGGMSRQLNTVLLDFSVTWFCWACKSTPRLSFMCWDSLVWHYLCVGLWEALTSGCCRPASFLFPWRGGKATSSSCWKQWRIDAETLLGGP